MKEKEDFKKERKKKVKRDLKGLQEKEMILREREIDTEVLVSFTFVLSFFYLSLSLLSSLRSPASIEEKRKKKEILHK